ncbi:Cytochrome P450 [Neofusicoccum parvum]|uniref:Cytochrome P450 n=1 Tax=Neofusicoccum parvum TaxID=310453 RepID=A0ACB5SBL5_9PEZI|nr:Cytochrome P450 [Neofusicoccum parvum]
MESLLRESQKFIPSPEWLGPALAAIAFHAAAQMVEIDLVVPYLAGAFVAAGAGILYVDVEMFSKPLSRATSDLAASTAIFALSLTTSIVVYRVFFHRLSRFPGPFAARVSRLHSVYKSIKHLQFHRELQQLHEKHGDVVRIGPRDLSVARVSALHPLAQCPKTVFYQQSNRDYRKVSMVATRNLDDHRKRRRPWEQAMGMKELSRYNANIQSIVDVFLNQIGQPEKVGKPFDVSERVYWLSYDLMGVIGYSRDFGNLKSSQEHAAVQNLRQAQVMLGYLKPVPWLINIMMSLPGASGAIAPFNEYCSQLVLDRQKALRKEKTEAPQDVVSWLLKAYEEKSPAAAQTKDALDEDSRALVTGGADTAASTMINALYYLATHPDAQAQLQRAVDDAMPDGEFEYNKIKDVPLLEAVINETLRLKPPVLSGNPRQTPPEGLRIDDDLYLPGGVDVVVPQWVVHRDERYFERPNEFVPERWVAGSDKAGMLKDRRAWFPFQIGTFMCVGKQLAYWEMKSVLGRVAARFDVTLAPGEDGKAFDEGFLDTFTMTVPSLRLCFNERKGPKP